uniref:Uncharacterized protein AlNc14C39G3371 n=1 Tax=Albugo laibachii Nc14 TaxID=890382 RepID=F0W9A4_9STRA|nr:conserved hypothetical protein [Albugo laibachii Nc14]CCA18363.1 conserved hypothetical protein [Albugo laibachii Nc14]|eukprot:CCA18363.1 conserved hypothetical protein [Albugo laibachii Nc14]
MTKSVTQNANGKGSKRTNKPQKYGVDANFLTGYQITFCTEENRVLRAKKPPVRPKNTLNGWLQIDCSNGIGEKAHSGYKNKHQLNKDVHRKMVQRLIRISDICRVCGRTSTKSSKRCDLRCHACEMTIHQECYLVKVEDTGADEWLCRHCEKAHGSMRDDRKNTNRNSRRNDCKYIDIQRDCNFAVAFRLLNRFRAMGLEVSTQHIELETLADAVLNPLSHEHILSRVYTQLLKNIGFPISKGRKWSDTLRRFIANSRDDHTILKCIDPNDSYSEMSLSSRILLLKYICEQQFDENTSLSDSIRCLENEKTLRDTYAGIDANDQVYWILENESHLNPSAFWLCRSSAIDGSNWEPVCTTLAELSEFLDDLSISTHSGDLSLWHRLTTTLQKRLKKLDNKFQVVSQRLASVSRRLRSSETNESSMLSFTPQRNLRQRKPVHYNLDEEDEDE